MTTNHADDSDNEVVTMRSRLSPSRAADFLSCPLKFRYRTIDRLPEPPSAVAVRGTLVHAVLEDLFDLPADERTPERAAALVEPAWDRVRSEDHRAAELFAQAENNDDYEAWLAGVDPLLATYFALENPRTLEPAEREVWIENRLDQRLTMNGIIDRLDIAPDGRIRVVDYKTGKAPGPRFEDQPLFQMKFYALVIWRTRGIVPSLLQLMYLGDGQILRHVPTERELEAVERKVLAIWDAIRLAVDRGSFPPKPSGLCRFCHFTAHCPTHVGGTILPMPTVRVN